MIVRDRGVAIVFASSARSTHGSIVGWWIVHTADTAATGGNRRENGVDKLNQVTVHGRLPLCW